MTCDWRTAEWLNLRCSYKDRTWICQSRDHGRPDKRPEAERTINPMVEARDWVSLRREPKRRRMSACSSNITISLSASSSPSEQTVCQSLSLTHLILYISIFANWWMWFSLNKFPIKWTRRVVLCWRALFPRTVAMGQAQTFGVTLHLQKRKIPL